MKQRKTLIALVVLVAVLVVGYFAWPAAFTVVPIAQVEQQKVSEAFDPVKYVDGIWASKILPTVNSKAVNLADILTAMKPDANGMAAKAGLIEVAKKYGLITVGEAHVYLVKGEGKVISVDDKTSLGVMQIQPAGYDGPIQVKVYLGPRIPSDETSVRDGVGFITFGDFKEQTEFGKVGAEINNRVLAGLSSLDKGALVGKTIAFTGAMTIRTFNLVNIDLKKVTIVPVKVEVKG
jgi:predicted lipoprotein